MEKFSADPVFSQEIKISQPEIGYRFSMDPFILATHIQPIGFEKIIDVGCGCGIIPLILASRYPDLKITGVEIQKELFQFAQKNTISNKLEKAIHIIHENIKNIDVSDINGKADIIVSNPPYKKKDTGRLNPDSQKAIARHEISLDLNQLFDSANRLLHENGRISLIFPAERHHNLEQAMADHGFFPKSIQLVHTQKNSPAKRLILCAVKNNNQPCTFPPPVTI